MQFRRIIAGFTTLTFILSNTSFVNGSATPLQFSISKPDLANVRFAQNQTDAPGTVKSELRQLMGFPDDIEISHRTNKPDMNEAEIAAALSQLGPKAGGSLNTNAEDDEKAVRLATLALLARNSGKADEARDLFHQAMKETHGNETLLKRVESIYFGPQDAFRSELRFDSEKVSEPAPADETDALSDEQLADIVASTSNKVVWIHRTAASEDTVKAILDEGLDLWGADGKLDRTASLMPIDREEALHGDLGFNHRFLRRGEDNFVIVIEIPRADLEKQPDRFHEPGTSQNTFRIFQGNDKLNFYAGQLADTTTGKKKMPPRFIKGYIDRRTMIFHPNPHFRSALRSELRSEMTKEKLEDRLGFTDRILLEPVSNLIADAVFAYNNGNETPEQEELLGFLQELIKEGKVTHEQLSRLPFSSQDAYKRYAVMEIYWGVKIQSVITLTKPSEIKSNLESLFAVLPPELKPVFITYLRTRAQTLPSSRSIAQQAFIEFATEATSRSELRNLVDYDLIDHDVTEEQVQKVAEIISRSGEDIPGMLAEYLVYIGITPQDFDFFYYLITGGLKQEKARAKDPNLFALIQQVIDHNLYADVRTRFINLALPDDVFVSKSRTKRTILWDDEKTFTVRREDRAGKVTDESLPKEKATEHLKKGTLSLAFPRQKEIKSLSRGDVIRRRQSRTTWEVVDVRRGHVDLLQINPPSEFTEKAIESALLDYVHQGRGRVYQRSVENRSELRARTKKAADLPQAALDLIGIEQTFTEDSDGRHDGWDVNEGPITQKAWSWFRNLLSQRLEAEVAAKVSGDLGLMIVQHGNDYGTFRIVRRSELPSVSQPTTAQHETPNEFRSELRSGVTKEKLEERLGFTDRILLEPISKLIADAVLAYNTGNETPEQEELLGFLQELIKEGKVTHEQLSRLPFSSQDAYKRYAVMEIYWGVKIQSVITLTKPSEIKSNLESLFAVLPPELKPVFITYLRTRTQTLPSSRSIAQQAFIEFATEATSRSELRRTAARNWKQILAATRTTDEVLAVHDLVSSVEIRRTARAANFETDIRKRLSRKVIARTSGDIRNVMARFPTFKTLVRSVTGVLDIQTRKRLTARRLRQLAPGSSPEQISAQWDQKYRVPVIRSVLARSELRALVKLSPAELESRSLQGLFDGYRSYAAIINTFNSTGRVKGASVGNTPAPLIEGDWTREIVTSAQENADAIFWELQRRGVIDENGAVRNRSELRSADEEDIARELELVNRARKQIEMPAAEKPKESRPSQSDEFKRFIQKLSATESDRIANSRVLRAIQDLDQRINAYNNSLNVLDIPRVDRLMVLRNKMVAQIAAKFPSAEMQQLLNTSEGVNQIYDALDPLRSELRSSDAIDKNSIAELEAFIPQVINDSFPQPTDATKQAMSAFLGHSDVVAILPNLAQLPDLLKAILEHLAGSQKVVVFAGTEGEEGLIRNYLMTRVPVEFHSQIEILTSKNVKAVFARLQPERRNLTINAFGIENDRQSAQTLKNLLEKEPVTVNDRISTPEQIASWLGLAGYMEELRIELRAKWAQAVSA